MKLPGHGDATEFRVRVAAGSERIAATANPGRMRVAVFWRSGAINYLAGVLGIEGPMPFPVAYVRISRVVVTRDRRRKVVSVNEQSTRGAEDVAPVNGGAAAPCQHNTKSTARRRIHP